MYCISHYRDRPSCYCGAVVINPQLEGHRFESWLLSLIRTLTNPLSMLVCFRSKDAGQENLHHPG